MIFGVEGSNRATTTNEGEEVLSRTLQSAYYFVDPCAIHLNIRLNEPTVCSLYIRLSKKKTLYKEQTICIKLDIEYR